MARLFFYTIIVSDTNTGSDIIVDFVMSKLYEHEQQQLHPIRSLLMNFRDVLVSSNLEALLDCYHVDIHFINPLFDLHGQDVHALWRMRWSAAYNFKASQKDDRVSVNEKGASTDWEAEYSPASMQGCVLLTMRSTFRIAEDKIIEQQDWFNMQQWIDMAYGIRLALFSRFGFAQWWAARQAQAELEAFKREQAI